jgi:hypothetical protein
MRGVVVDEEFGIVGTDFFEDYIQIQALVILSDGRYAVVAVDCWAYDEDESDIVPTFAVRIHSDLAVLMPRFVQDRGGRLFLSERAPLGATPTNVVLRRQIGRLWSNLDCGTIMRIAADGLAYNHMDFFIWYVELWVPDW